MIQYVELQRRFHPLSDKELKDIEIYSISSEYWIKGSLSWKDLLEKPRVLILAEAGSGKTREMQRQAQLLRDEGKTAFFIPLELLAEMSPDELPNAGRDFQAWKASNSLGWFFLDSVDELKLTQTKFSHALARFSNALGSARTRARIVISSRPHDWQASVDLEHFRSELPLPPPLPDDARKSAEEIFRSALRRNLTHGEDRNPQTESAETAEICTVMLAPLDRHQIERFASIFGVDQMGEFLQEIERENAWHFARRPLDLGDLVTIWRLSGTIGTRASQHEANVVNKLRDDPDRHDSGHLSDEKARLGAERLALAMIFSKRRDLRSYEASLMPSTEADDLDPGLILSDWNVPEKQALLRRAIFQPSMYGRIRFHHRSVQEYLAACRLCSLRKQGMAVKALFRLLFAETYGVKIVIPSMRAVAAWLALWDADVCKEVLSRQPELLLQEGDPGSLELPIRRRLLSSYGSAYGKGNWRGLSIAREEIQRLAHPDLGPDIMQMWSTGIENEEVKDLLLDLVQIAKIESCASLAASVIWDTTASDTLKFGALDALLACDDNDALTSLARTITLDPSQWRKEFIRISIVRLFPKFITADQLVVLTEKFAQRRARFTGDSWHYLQQFKAVELTGATGNDLMNGLANLILRNATMPSQYYRLSSDFSHLIGPLLHVCLEQYKVADGELLAQIIENLAIAARFRGDSFEDEEIFAATCNLFRSDPSLRRKVFEADYSLMTRLTTKTETRSSVLHFQHQSLISGLVPDDAVWLEELLESSSDLMLNKIVFEILLKFWDDAGRDLDRVERLRNLAGSDTDLRLLLSTYESPPPRDPKLVEMEKERDQHRHRYEQQEAERLENWEAWREKVVANPHEAFSADEVGTTISNLHLWLMGLTRSGNYCGVWDRDAILAVFGEEVLGLAEKAFQKWWRNVRPQLPSQKGEDLKHGTPYTWLYGLTGIESEATDPLWANKLSDDLAALATIYATVEINGLAPFLSDLAHSHPRTVEKVLGCELEAEFKEIGHSAYLRTLQDLTHDDHYIQNLIAPTLLKLFLSYNTSDDIVTGSHLAHNITQVFKILMTETTEPQKALVSDKCHSEYLRDPGSINSSLWLKGLFLFSPLVAVSVFEDRLKTNNETTRRDAIQQLAVLFGERGTQLLIPNPDDRAAALARLIRLAYRFVRPDEDNRHEGPYSMDTRDHAEAARSNLLTALLETPGRTAQNEIRSLATEANLSGLSDRLLYLARERAAKDSELAPSSVNEIRALESRSELPPIDQAGLFRVMMDRLDDLAHEIANHDFSDRATLQKITDEVEMQRILALRLEKAANSCYSITRESEMADLKRNDLQLNIPPRNVHVVIEVKLADNNGWSAGDFKSFLLTQLRGQYLRHQNCTAGCMLLLYRGQKSSWRHPEKKSKMDFADLVAYLKQCAENEWRMEGNTHRIELAVVGIDLRDPSLPSPHRSAAGRKQVPTTKRNKVSKKSPDGQRQLRKKRSN